MKIKAFIFFIVFCLLNAAFTEAAAPKKLRSWTKRDLEGRLVFISQDKNGDGKPDAWIFYRNDAVYKREWDRNFDGKADFRIFESRGRFLSKEYDNDHDGKFETRESAPLKGSSGKARYLASEINAAN